MIRSSAWKTDHQLGLKIAVDLFLQEERTRLRRWRFLGRFDFYVGIIIIVETNKKLNFFRGRTTTHEVAFRKVYEIMAESSEGSFHYPPLSPEEVIILDSMEQSDTSHETNDEQGIPVYGLLKPERILLDSLLSEIGCGFILVDRREWGTACLLYTSQFIKLMVEMVNYIM